MINKACALVDHLMHTDWYRITGIRKNIYILSIACTWCQAHLNEYCKMLKTNVSLFILTIYLLCFNSVYTVTTSPSLAQCSDWVWRHFSGSWCGYLSHQHRRLHI